jgi:hypothetical protein
MPHIRFETNIQIPDDKSRNVLLGLGAELSRLMSLPAGEVRVEVAGGRRMRLAGDGDMVAHIEIRQCDYPRKRSEELLDAFARVVDGNLGIGRENIYIAVISNRNSMWKVLGNE